MICYKFIHIYLDDNYFINHVYLTLKDAQVACCNSFIGECFEIFRILNEYSDLESEVEDIKLIQNINDLIIKGSYEEASDIICNIENFNQNKYAIQTSKIETDIKIDRTIDQTLLSNELKRHVFK